MIWEWRQPGRRKTTIGLLAVIWVGIAVLWSVFDAWPLILILIGGATLPAIWDVVRGRDMRLAVFPDRIDWESGVRSGSVPLASGTSVSLRRRYDGGLRIVVTAPPGTGGETRLPPELAPPLVALEEALKQTPANVRRDPFRLI